MSHVHHHREPASGSDFDSRPPSEHEIMSRAMQELLEARGVITAEQVRRRMEQFEEDFPHRGSRVIAHAWVDAAFRKRLLADGKAACAEFGVDLEADWLIALENTPQRRHALRSRAHAPRGLGRHDLRGQPDMLRQAAIVLAALALLPALAGCEPRPPKPKTELEKQASPTGHAVPQPVVAQRPGHSQH
jgi:hypothetical protein